MNTSVGMGAAHWVITQLITKIKCITVGKKLFEIFSFREVFIKIFRKMANEAFGQALRTPKEETKRFIFLWDLKQEYLKGRGQIVLNVQGTPHYSIKKWGTFLKEKGKPNI